MKEFKIYYNTNNDVQSQTVKAEDYYSVCNGNAISFFVYDEEGKQKVILTASMHSIKFIVE